jgi:hypothetical protein
MRYLYCDKKLKLASIDPAIESTKWIFKRAIRHPFIESSFLIES